MTLNRLLLTTSLCAVVALPAAAQQTFDAVDTDGNGSLNFSELEAVFGSEGASRILSRIDDNKDGFVTLDEARNSQDDEDDEDDDDEDDEDDDEDDDENDDNDEDDDSEDDDDEDDDEDDDDDDDEDDDKDGKDGKDDNESDESDDE